MNNIFLRFKKTGAKKHKIEQVAISPKSNSGRDRFCALSVYTTFSDRDRDQRSRLCSW